MGSQSLGLKDPRASLKAKQNLIESQSQEQSADLSIIHNEAHFALRKIASYILYRRHCCLVLYTSTMTNAVPSRYNIIIKVSNHNAVI